MNHNKMTKDATRIISNYDFKDLLATLGAMNLSFTNQNKNYATSYYTTYILFNQNHNKPKASRKTLLSLIDELNRSGIIPPIQDPPEAPFFQRVLFDREYYVFNGVDHHSAFFVSRLNELLLFGDCSSLPEQFVTLLRKIVKAVLSLSDYIYKNINIKYDDVMNYAGDNDIVLPSNVEQLKSLLYFDKNELYKLGLSEEDFQRYMAFHYSLPLSLNECLEKEIPYYYRRPFLDIGDKLLIIDPTAINTYIRFVSVELAELFKCKQNFIALVNDLFFSWGEWQIRKFILKLYDEENPFVSLKFSNDDIYKETIIPFSKSKIIVYSACFGNELEGKSVDIKINKYHSMIKKQLDELPEKYEVISVVLWFSYGVDIRVKESTVFNNNSLMIAFDEFESLIINERNDPCFLFNAVDFIHNTMQIFSPNMGLINRIAFLHDRDYDFYLDDKADAYNTNLFIGFEYTYHYRVMATKEETALIVPFNKRLLFLEKESDGVYFLSDRFFDAKNIITYNKYPSGGVWVFSSTITNNIITFIGTINYWLTNLKPFLANYIKDDAYYIELVVDMNSGVIDRVGNTCVLNLYSFLPSLHGDNGLDEIGLMERVLNSIGLLLPPVKKQLDKDRLDVNKRFNTSITGNQIMLIPFKKHLRPVFVSKYHSSLLDDYLAREYAMKECGLVPGAKIDNADSYLKGAVDKLFKDLDKYAKKFNWFTSAMFLFEYQEDYLQKLLISKMNLKVKHALYSNQIEEINKNYYDLNSASPGIRFLLQYLGTMQYKGEKTMDEADLEILITLIHKMIHLANIDDGIVFNILPKELVFLEAKRLAIDLTNLETFNSLVANEMINDLTSSNISFNNNQNWPYNEELNEAYLEEYGFTFDQMSQVIALLIAIGEDQEDEIKTSTIENVIKRFGEPHDPKIIIDETIISMVINHLSIAKRSDYFDLSVAKRRDLYPWRYNRTESITRKPLIKYGNNIIWGNRTLYQSYVFVVEHIYEGNEPTKNPSSGKIKTLNGKVLELKGERFNDYAYDYLTKTIPDFRFYKGVKSVNNKRVKNDKGEFLGDIDILGIDEQRHRIYLIEAKNYSYSKNMAEFGFEQNEFLGTPKKKGFVEKEMNRVKWIKSHIEDVKKEYGLNGGNWKVLYTFLSDKPLLCSVFGGASFNNVSISDINKKYLNSLNE